MKLLLPFNARYYGYFLLFLSIVLAIIRFYFDIKLKVLDVKVFAVYSKYFETNYFTLISNHISEELIALGMILGLLLINFSSEKIETEVTQSLRYKALILTFYINSFFLIFSVLFIYGFVFINVIVLNLFTPLIFYIIIFKILLFRSNSKKIASIS